MTDDETKRFINVAYEESAKLLDKSDLEMLTARDQSGATQPDVRITHKPSGIVVDESRFPTQTMNAVIARIRLFDLIRNLNK